MTRKPERVNCLYLLCLALNSNPVLNAVKIWILFSTLLVASGWVLSAFHALNPAGYGFVFVLAIAALVYWLRRAKWHPRNTPAQWFQKFKRRFRRPAPLLFLALTCLSLIAGALYASQNNDSNEYRIPRVWHWLAAGQWHWIRTLDPRMNVAGCNFEWLVAPLMLFTRHDRFLFIVNWVSYLLLPGLIFSVFTRLEVRPRVAWWWMWLLSSGWCYVMQASADVNDSFAAVYALASVDFALRARERQSVSDIWFSILAVALLTGAKQTDIPLVIPWAVAVLPSLRLMKKNVPAMIVVLLLAALVSALPLSYFNFKHTGTWDGFPAYSTFWKLESPSWSWGFVGNLFCLPLQNLVPPIFPPANQWNAEMQHFLRTSFGSHFQSFESFGHLSRSVSEGTAGIGLFVVVLAAVSILMAGFYRRKFFRVEHRPFKNNLQFWLRWVPFLSFFLFMCKVVTLANARQCAAYYIFLFPTILVASGQARVVQRRGWQMCALLAMLLTAGMLVVSRNRPLFPAETILSSLLRSHPQWHWLSRAQASFGSRASIDTQRNAFENVIPAGERVIGYATVRGSQEAGKWVPFGKRRVERVLPNDDPAELQANGIHYVLVDSDGLGLLNMTIGDWTNQFNGTLVGTIEYEQTAETTARDYLVRLNTPGRR